MKKILQSVMVIGLIVAFSTSANAQVKFGVKAGLNFSNVSFTGDEEGLDTKMKIGFNVGGVVNYTISESFDLQSGLSLTTKGFKSEFSYSQDNGYKYESKNTFSLTYLEIPINAIYKIEKLQIYAGPYLAFGLAGKMKSEWSEIDGADSYSGNDEYKLKPKSSGYDYDSLGDEEAAFRGFDYGLNFGIGYELGPVLVNAGYSLGLGNVDVDDKDGNYSFLDEDNKMKNGVISLSATYMF